MNDDDEEARPIPMSQLMKKQRTDSEAQTKAAAPAAKSRPAAKSGPSSATATKEKKSAAPAPKTGRSAAEKKKSGQDQKKKKSKKSDVKAKPAATPKREGYSDNNKLCCSFVSCAAVGSIDTTLHHKMKNFPFCNNVCLQLA